MALNVKLKYGSKSQIENMTLNAKLVDPHPIHRPTQLVILNVKGKTGFRVLKNSS